MKPLWVCSIADDGRVCLRILEVDGNGVNTAVDITLLPEQAVALGEGLLRVAGAAKRAT